MFKRTDRVYIDVFHFFFRPSFSNSPFSTFCGCYGLKLEIAFSLRSRRRFLLEGVQKNIRRLRAVRQTRLIVFMFIGPVQKCELNAQNLRSLDDSSKNNTLSLTGPSVAFLDSCTVSCNLRTKNPRPLYDDFWTIVF